MNRKERRAQNKHLRAIKGGQAPSVPHVQKQSDATAPGRLFNALDRAVRGQLVADAKELDVSLVVATMMRFAANVAAAHAVETGAEVSGAEYGTACGTVFDEEIAAIRARLPKSV